MQHARGMGGGEALRQLHADAYDLLLRQRTGGHARVERHAADELAHQQVVAVDAIEVVDGLDGWVIQARQHPRFVAEALARRLIVQRAGGEDLDREIATELHIVGAIDDAHPTGADDLLDPVTPDGLAWFERHCWRTSPYLTRDSPSPLATRCRHSAACATRTGSGCARFHRS